MKTVPTPKPRCSIISDIQGNSASARYLTSSQFTPGWSEAINWLQIIRKNNRWINSLVPQSTKEAITGMKDKNQNDSLLMLKSRQRMGDWYFMNRLYLQVYPGPVVQRYVINSGWQRNTTGLNHRIPLIQFSLMLFHIPCATVPWCNFAGDLSSVMHWESARLCDSVKMSMDNHTLYERPITSHCALQWDNGPIFSWMIRWTRVSNPSKAPRMWQCADPRTAMSAAILHRVQGTWQCL